MISKYAILGEQVKIGHHVVLEDDVIIGDHVEIGHHVVIKSGTVIGSNVTISDGAILGKKPATNRTVARKPENNLGALTVHNHVHIGNQAVIYEGTTIMNGVLIGDLASIRENSFVGDHSIVGRQVIVENNTEIGEQVTIQTSAYITANMTIANDVFIGPAVVTSNDKYMGMGTDELAGPSLRTGCKIGCNATLLPEITIGEYAIVGAGAVVIKDVEISDTVVGNPAKPINRE